MNIAEILKKYGEKGDMLYTPLYGKVTLEEINTTQCPIVVRNSRGSLTFFTCDGKYTDKDSDDTECLLFPSKEQRDWDEYVRLKEGVEVRVGNHVWYKGRQYIIAEIKEGDIFITDVVCGYGNHLFVYRASLTAADKFDHSTLRPFDKVLVRCSDTDYWKASFFSHVRSKEERCEDECDEYKYLCMEYAYCECIPYNSETEHLVGTIDEAPEFYREE